MDCLKVLNGCLCGRVQSYHRPQLQPVLRAVQYQSTLRTMDLSRVRLGDQGFKYLYDILHTLTALDALNLATSGISHTSVSLLCDGIAKDEVGLKHLR